MNQTPTSAESSPAEDDSDNAPPGPRRGGRFPAAARWTIVFTVVILALVVAIWPRGDDRDSGTEAPPTATGVNVTDAPVDDAQLAQARSDAALPPCPETGLPAGPQAALAGVTVPCLADGADYDIGAGTAGRPTVINMWAVWCLPCRRELPVVDDYAQRAGDQVNVVAVHAQEGAQNPYMALRFLHENDVRLPSVLDTDAEIAAALGAPRVFPSTILVRADGTVAKVLPQVFHQPDEIADAVQQYLGVTT
ncbi:TlpA disulfide reductase family protein [Gordonia sp. LSe1-13]|uniref:TlpA disulfide reductase family protein n=1 Tax=Gordonia sesuvii TaxID=3116777 RepID=A0ABU7MEX0_9ACTN|nr:TlpA disulfide reductase family protein [Gordonia sp. LSe1-13]